MQTLTFDEFAKLYCETQEQTPQGLLDILQAQRTRYSPDCWVLLRCIVLDSSRLGARTIVPVGPRNTWTTIPPSPISPRGLCSDISEIEAVLPAANLPVTDNKNA